MSWLPDIHFEISERKILLRLFDLVFIFLFLIIVSQSFSFDYFIITGARWTWTIILALYFSLFASIFELYDLQKASSFQTTLKNIVLTVSITVLFYLLTPYYTPLLPENRLQIVFFFVAMVLGLIVWRYAYITLISAPRFNKRVFVVGDSYNINGIVKNLHLADPNYRVVGYINTDNASVEADDKQLEAVRLEDLSRSIKTHGISEIVVASANAGVSYPLYNQLIQLLESGFPIREYTQVYEEITKRVPVQHVEKDFYKYFPFSRSSKNRFYTFFHRFFDILFAIVAIFFSILILPLILVGNLIANRGPLFYFQQRVGRNGVPFKIVKFRTMIVDAENNGAQWSVLGDKRVTKFGRFLRHSRVDELPQCFNVLKGEMSFIGPRPERPVFVNELSKEIPFYETRHIIKPGLTGWAQVMGRYGSSQDDALEKLQYDLYYIKHRNLFLDLNIVLKTISTVLYYRGQ